MTAQPPRLPAVDAREPRTPSVSGTETGTGVLNRHGGAQAADIAARILVGSDWDDEDSWGDGEREHIRHWAEGVDNELRSVHLREAAASLRAIAEHMPDTSSAAELRPGIRYAATLLGHTADDLTEGAPE